MTTQTGTQRGQLKTLNGVVVSDKMDQTIVVSVGRKYKHARYGKFMTTRKKYYVHDPKNEAKTGDQVEIRFCRPISKTKKWR
ncbi:MAG: 30S ribosomal protein S17, partial [Pseudomonadota bacterium]